MPQFQHYSVRDIIYRIHTADTHCFRKTRYLRVTAGTWYVSAGFKIDIFFSFSEYLWSVAGIFFAPSCPPPDPSYLTLSAPTDGKPFLGRGSFSHDLWPTNGRIMYGIRRYTRTYIVYESAKRAELDDNDDNNRVSDRGLKPDGRHPPRTEYTYDDHICINAQSAGRKNRI